ncbi:MAG TPA: glycosyltransferase family 4 protein [Polyangiales bacterium]
MRIAYLVSQYPAPSHTFIRREVAALRARGAPIETYSVRRPSEPERSAALDRSAYEQTYYLLPPRVAAALFAHAAALLGHPLAYLGTLRLSLRHRVPGLSALIWSVFHFAEAIVLASELRRRGVTHLHNHFANAGATVGLLAAHFLQLPWSLTLHGTAETDYPAGLLLGAKLEAAQFAVCVSHFGRAQAMRVTAPEHWHKLFICRCALDLSQLPERVARTDQARARIVCVGRLSPEKGHLGLLEAFASARAQGVDAQLVLIGDGPERARIETRLSELGLREHVQLRGQLDEQTTLAEVASSDVLVLASFLEGLPVVLMEAMALGLAVIGPRVAGVPELVHDGESGLLFAAGDWNELAEQLKRVLADPELRARLGRAGRAKVEAEFEIGRAIEPLLAHFNVQG